MGEQLKAKRRQRQMGGSPKGTGVEQDDTCLPLHEIAPDAEQATDLLLREASLREQGNRRQALDSDGTQRTPTTLGSCLIFEKPKSTVNLSVYAMSTSRKASLVSPARTSEEADGAELREACGKAGDLGHAARGRSVYAGKENILDTAGSAKRKASEDFVDGNARKYGPSTGQHVEECPSEGAFAPCQAH